MCPKAPICHTPKKDVASCNTPVPNQNVFLDLVPLPPGEGVRFSAPFANARSDPSPVISRERLGEGSGPQQPANPGATSSSGPPSTKVIVLILTPSTKSALIHSCRR